MGQAFIVELLGSVTLCKHAMRASLKPPFAVIRCPIYTFSHIVGLIRKKCA